MKFDEWFKAQFGTRLFSAQTEDELHEMIRLGEKARDELARRLQQEELRRAALYAWQVKDEDKK